MFGCEAAFLAYCRGISIFAIVTALWQAVCGFSWHKHLRRAVYVLMHHMLWKKQSEVCKRKEAMIYYASLQ